MSKDVAGTPLRQQSGAHAIEYAVVFPVFFMMLYAILAYGMIFTMRLGLQHAADTGARAALRYQPPTLPTDNQIALREGAAETVARNAAVWLSNIGTITVVVDICPVGTDCLTDPGVKLPDNLTCGNNVADGCQVVVFAEFPYATNPIFPALPGFGLLMPDRIQGRARMLLDGRGVSL